MLLQDLDLISFLTTHPQLIETYDKDDPATFCHRSMVRSLEMNIPTLVIHPYLGHEEAFDQIVQFLTQVFEHELDDSRLPMTFINGMPGMYYHVTLFLIY